MSFDGHKNLAVSAVVTAPSPADSGLSLVVTAADGAKMPAVPFNVTIWPAGVQPTTANAEIARCTGRATDTLTIVRAQEGTVARTVLVGDQIAATVTVKTITDVESLMTGPSELNIQNNTPTADIVIPAGYSAVVSGVYEISSGNVLEIGDSAIMEIL